VTGKQTNTNHDPIQRISYFRFYEELNDFLPKKWSKKKFEYSFTGITSVKNIIEAIGVPHVEIDLILVDGESVAFDFILRGGEQISVYPVFESFDISPVIRLRAKPLRAIKFIVDVNLGKLAQKLRLLGFDTSFKNDYDDNCIVADSVKEKRIILTRDIGLLKRGAATHGLWIRNDDPKKQLTEVIERLQLQNSFKPFSRCSVCNSQLKLVEKSEIQNKLQADTFETYDEFWQCAGCRKIYWEGSHYDRILEWLDRMNGGNQKF
jgi:hypothetical protein